MRLCQFSLAAVLVAGVPILAQSGNPITDGMMRGAAIGSAMRAAERDAEEAALLRQRRLMLERRELDAAIKAQEKPPEPEPKAAPEADASDRQLVTAAIRAAKELHPDFAQFEAEIFRLAGSFRREDGPWADYVEGLYAIAKYSMFSRSPSSVVMKAIRAQAQGAIAEPERLEKQ